MGIKNVIIEHKDCRAILSLDLTNGLMGNYDDNFHLLRLSSKRNYPPNIEDLNEYTMCV